MKICANCNNEVEKEATSCSACGSELFRHEEQQVPKVNETKAQKSPETYQLECINENLNTIKNILVFWTTIAIIAIIIIALIAMYYFRIQASN